MNIKETSETIQKQIDDLQWAIQEMDYDFKYYRILIPDMSENPMAIQFFRHEKSKEDKLLHTFKIDFLDLFYCKNLIDFFNNEKSILLSSNAASEQIKELDLLRSNFGI